MLDSWVLVYSASAPLTLTDICGRNLYTSLVVFHEAVEDDVTSGNLSEAHNTSTIIRNTAKLSTEHMSQMLYVGKSARGSVL